MIEQYLSNKNKNITVSFSNKIYELNKDKQGPRWHPQFLLVLQLFTADHTGVAVACPVARGWCRGGCGWDRLRRPRQAHMRGGRGARWARAAAPRKWTGQWSGGHGGRRVVALPGPLAPRNTCTAGIGVRRCTAGTVAGRCPPQFSVGNQRLARPHGIHGSMLSRGGQMESARSPQGAKPIRSMHDL